MSGDGPSRRKPMSAAMSAIGGKTDVARASRRECLSGPHHRGCPLRAQMRDSKFDAGRFRYCARTLEMSGGRVPEKRLNFNQLRDPY